jgi:hypothetical protein
VKQQHTSTATSILTTKSTYRSLSAQRLSERTVFQHFTSNRLLSGWRNKKEDERGETFSHFHSVLYSLITTVWTSCIRFTAILYYNHHQIFDVLEVVNIYTFYGLQSFYTVFSFHGDGRPDLKHVAVGGFYNVNVIELCACVGWNCSNGLRHVECMTLPMNTWISWSKNIITIKVFMWITENRAWVYTDVWEFSERCICRGEKKNDRKLLLFSSLLIVCVNDVLLSVYIKQNQVGCCPHTCIITLWGWLGDTVSFRQVCSERNVQQLWLDNPRVVPGSESLLRQWSVSQSDRSCILNPVPPRDKGGCHGQVPGVRAVTSWDWWLLQAIRRCNMEKCIN